MGLLPPIELAIGYSITPLTGLDKARETRSLVGAMHSVNAQPVSQRHVNTGRLTVQLTADAPIFHRHRLTREHFLQNGAVLDFALGPHGDLAGLVVGAVVEHQRPEHGDTQMAEQPLHDRQEWPDRIMVILEQDPEDDLSSEMLDSVLNDKMNLLRDFSDL